MKFRSSYDIEDDLDKLQAKGKSKKKKFDKTVKVKSAKLKKKYGFSKGKKIGKRKANIFSQRFFVN